MREIAAVKGIGVLWPGAGTLRGVFSTTTPPGERSLDEEAWEAAIQQVLSACKEFKVACGFPANAERHRDADEAGLQRVRDELGRRRLQGPRSRPADCEQAVDERVGTLEFKVQSAKFKDTVQRHSSKTQFKVSMSEPHRRPRTQQDVIWHFAL